MRVLRSLHVAEGSKVSFLMNEDADLSIQGLFLVLQLEARNAGVTLDQSAIVCVPHI